jgi:hypothetical protein
MSMLDRTHGQDDNGYFQALLEGNGHRYHQAAALAAAAGTNSSEASVELSLLFSSFHFLRSLITTSMEPHFS